MTVELTNVLNQDSPKNIVAKLTTTVLANVLLKYFPKIAKYYTNTVKIIVYMNYNSYLVKTVS